MKPLNLTLYRNLQRIFGKVRISNQGQAMVAEYVPDLWNPGHATLDRTVKGEHYAVSCDRCNDTRFRLYINHMWGQSDVLGRRNLWMIYCQNEDCYSDPEARRELFSRMSDLADPISDRPAEPEEGRVVTEASVVRPPGVIVSLTRLPENHPANRYLAFRFCDTQILAGFYGVGYCTQTSEYLARDRIYIPLYQDGQLKGWQCRYVGDLDWKDKANPPKYWSCPHMDRRLVLYNYDNAVRYRACIVVEGSPGVWNIGPMAVATLGFPITHDQRRKLYEGFAGRPLVYVSDPDVSADPGKLKQLEDIEADMKSKHAPGVAVIRMPDGYDPADLDRGFIRRYITQEAKEQGVEISWAPVS